MRGYKNIPGWFSFSDVYDRAIAKFPDKSRFLEIGCLFGASTVYLLEKIKESGRDIAVSVIDLWDEKLLSLESKAYLQGRPPLQAFQDNLRAEGLLKGLRIYMGDSLEIGRNMPDREFDFIFLDSNHTYEHVREEIAIYRKKLRSGGVLAGHDYIPQFPGVIRAVNEAFPEREIMGMSWWVQL